MHIGFIFLLLLPFVLLFSDKPTEKTTPVIVLFGPPASGKGTQAVRLAEELNIPHISTGDLFRENINKNTSLGQKAKQYIDSGKLVPDDLVLELLFDRLEQPDTAKGYILDGVPRTIYQAEAIEKKLPQHVKLIVLNLVVSDNTIIQRALGRKRNDDTPTVVQERLNNYYAQTAPLIDYFNKKGVLTNVDGEKTPEAVFSALKQSLLSKNVK